MGRRKPFALLAASCAAVALVAAPAHGAIPSGNLVVNPGAEDGQPGSPTPLPGWTPAGGFTAVAYGQGYPPPPPDGGANFFAAGTAEPSTAHQTIDLSAARPEIDRGLVRGVLSAYVHESLTTLPEVKVAFFDSRGKRIGRNRFATGGSGGVFERGSLRVEVPRGARSARVTLEVLPIGSPPDGYFDNVSLTLLRRTVARPDRGRNVVVTPTKGVTVVERRGHGKTRITEPTLLPVGTTIDTSRGTATVESAADSRGTEVQRGRFSGGVFAVTQPRGNPTVLSLGGPGPRTCDRPRPRRISSRAPDGFIVLAGAMATGSEFGMANWKAIDRCDAADMKVRDGEVKVGSVGSRQTSDARAVRLFMQADRPRRGGRRLFGGRGRFRTRGRNSSATVRGRIVVDG